MPGQGKSKLIQFNTQLDIDDNYSVSLFDPSDNGDTLLKVLKHCYLHDYRKVCIIDPHDVVTMGAVSTINPLHAPTPVLAADNMVDAVQIAWETSVQGYANIRRFLPATFEALYILGLTTAELRFFAKFDAYKDERTACLNKLPYDLRKLLEPHYQNISTFQKIEPTTSRFSDFLNPVLMAVFGSTKNPIDFKKLLREHWFIGVNLESEGLYPDSCRKILGTVIINQIIQAIWELRQDGLKPVHYMTIDEAQDYATPKVATILDKKRKSGLRLTLAHHGFDQIKDTDIQKAIMRCAIKVLFHTDEPANKTMMLRLMSTEDPGIIRKQHALVRNNKKPAAVVRFVDVPDYTEVTRATVDTYKSTLYNTQPWMQPSGDVQKETDARQQIYWAGNPKAPEGRAADDSPTTGDGVPVQQTRRTRRVVLSEVREQNIRLPEEPQQDSGLAPEKPRRRKTPPNN